MASDIPQLADFVRLNASHVEQAAGMFARAFHSDPLYCHFFPADRDRERMLPAMFRFRLRYGLLAGEVYASSPGMEAAAIWIPSQNDHMTFGRMLRTGGLGVFLSAGSAARKRMQRAIRWAGEIHARQAGFPHWHLSPIATDPARQGKGYAGALIRAMLARLDAERVPCFLEAQTERNVPLYEHFGFKVVEHGTIPGTQIGHWAMLRRPAGA
ncbi:MAG: GNAT family N-acetyltransferase [Chloroflexi bacterium]|nr:GNAT family N-acetyltransferase [Chloroflexota bacterium]